MESAALLGKVLRAQYNYEPPYSRKANDSTILEIIRINYTINCTRTPRRSLAEIIRLHDTEVCSKITRTINVITIDVYVMTI